MNELIFPELFSPFAATLSMRRLGVKLVLFAVSDKNVEYRV